METAHSTRNPRQNDILAGIPNLIACTISVKSECQQAVGHSQFFALDGRLVPSDAC